MDNGDLAVFFQDSASNGRGKYPHFLKILHMFSASAGGRNLVEFLAGGVAPHAMSGTVIDKDCIADPVKDGQQIVQFDCLHNIVSHSVSFSYLYI